MSDTSLLRRTPKGDRRDTWHTVFIALLIFLLAIGAMHAPSLLFRYLWIDVKSVTVPDHLDDEDPLIEVYRRIRKDTWGTFSVTIRRAEDSRYICTTGPDRPFSYSRAADRIQPLIVPLSAWLDSRAAMDDCIERGFGTGKFYLSTCHFRTVWGINIARRCTHSNIFERRGRP